MEKDTIIPFSKPSADLIDIVRHFSGEYRPRAMSYVLDGVFHILFMHEAGKLKSEQEVPDFMRRFSIQPSQFRSSPFDFSVDTFIESGLLTPQWTRTVVNAFNEDNRNLYPGISEKDLDTDEWKRQMASARFLVNCKWTPADFLNPDIIKQGMEFATGLWRNSVQSYKKYEFPEMKAEISQNAQKLLDYYSLIIQQTK